MISRVAHKCQEAVGIENVYVVTDDERIGSECRLNGIQFILSEGLHLTGTDRIASVSSGIEADIFLNVQGDEPCISVDDINRAIFEKAKNPNHVVNGFCTFISRPSDSTPSVPKVVVNDRNELIYISRSNVPMDFKKLKEDQSQQYKRQVCIYAYSQDELAKFYGMGRRGTIESLEDIEILRCLEIGIPVKMIEMSPSLAVDYPEDISKVEQLLAES